MLWVVRSTTTSLSVRSEGSGQDDSRRCSRPSPSDPYRITIREFISHWNAKRRGYRKVAQIRRDLKERGLKTVPDFASGWIDNTITILPAQVDDASPSANSGADLQVVDSDDPEVVTRVALLVDDLESASGLLCSVRMDATLMHVQALMMRHDYSQLAVMSDARQLRGAVTWESIAQAKLRNPDATLRDALVSAPTVKQYDPLLDHVSSIVDAGFVFVRAPDRSIVGIVTRPISATSSQRWPTPSFCSARSSDDCA